MFSILTHALQRRLRSGESASRKVNILVQHFRCLCSFYANITDCFMFNNIYFSQICNRIVVTQPTGNVWEFENEWRHTLFNCCVDSKQCFCAFTCYCCFVMELFSRTGKFSLLLVYKLTRRVYKMKINHYFFFLCFYRNSSHSLI